MAHIDLEQFSYISASTPWDIKNLFSEMISACRVDGSRKICTALNESDLPNNVLADEFAVDRALISRLKVNDTTNPGAYILPCRSIPVACYKHLKKSCHETFFEEKKEIALPRHLSRFVSEITALPKDRKIALRNYIKFTYDKRKMTRLLEPSPTDITTKRLREYAEERLIEPEDILTSYRHDYDNDAPPTMFKSIVNMPVIINATQRGPSLSSVLSLAVILNVSLDYLLAIDYTSYCDIVFSDSDTSVANTGYKSWSKLTDPVAIYALQNYLRIPEEKQTELYTTVMAYCLNQ